MKIYVGQKVRVKQYKKRPNRWNGVGKMDVFMGKIVTIRSINERITIEEDNRESKNFFGPDSLSYRDFWAFTREDFEPIVDEVLPQELFEI